MLQPQFFQCVKCSSGAVEIDLRPESEGSIPTYSCGFGFLIFTFLFNNNLLKTMVFQYSLNL